jgi:hypothetical protein
VVKTRNFASLLIFKLTGLTHGNAENVDALAVKQCVGRVPRLKATAEPEGLAAGYHKGHIDALAVKQCVGRVPRLEATAEPEGLPAG